MQPDGAEQSVLTTFLVQTLRARRRDPPRCNDLIEKEYFPDERFAADRNEIAPFSIHTYGFIK